MKVVRWEVSCVTYVNSDDDAEARTAVEDMFEDRPWGKTGPCRSTAENMQVLTVTDVG